MQKHMTEVEKHLRLKFNKVFFYKFAFAPTCVCQNPAIYLCTILMHKQV